MVMICVDGTPAVNERYVGLEKTGAVNSTRLVADSAPLPS
jgi:hypothetical protein